PPGDGPARGAAGDRGVGTRRCTAGADRWPHGLRHGTAAPVWAVEAPRTAPGPRPHTPAEVDALARAALCARGAVVPAPAPRGRSTRRGVRHAAGHRAGPGGGWLDAQPRL